MEADPPTGGTSNCVIGIPTNASPAKAEVEADTKSETVESVTSEETTVASGEASTSAMDEANPPAVDKSNEPVVDAPQIQEQGTKKDEKDDSDVDDFEREMMAGTDKDDFTKRVALNYEESKAEPSKAVGDDEVDPDADTASPASDQEQEVTEE